MVIGKDVSMIRHLAFLSLLTMFGLLVNINIGLPSESTKIISGFASGELLLNFSIQDSTPTFSSRYNYYIENIHIPPITSTFNISYPHITSNLNGYAYETEGVYIPCMPNNFTVSVTGVKNLNIGLKKQQGSYENSSNVWNDKYTRMWISSRAEADNHDVATMKSYLISPGIYQVKIFGDATENVSRVNLTMTLVKKIIVNGRFNIGINTTGFPSGNYSITAKALNGSFRLDEIKLDDLGPKLK